MAVIVKDEAPATSPRSSFGLILTFADNTGPIACPLPLGSTVDGFAFPPGTFGAAMTEGTKAAPRPAVTMDATR